jgi:hypothetical protein
MPFLGKHEKGFLKYMDKVGTREHWLEREVIQFAEDRREWIREVMADKDLEPLHRLVGVAIGLRINHRTENAWPGIPTIAKDVGASPRTVLRAIEVLAGEDKPKMKDGQIVKPSLGKKYLKVSRKKRAGNKYEMIFKRERIM